MKVISAKRWSYRLKGKDAAIRLNSICGQYLDDTDHLCVSMAGVKYLSEGFAFECFGPLYLRAKRTNKKLTFDCIETGELRSTLLSGIANYYRLRAADPGSAS